MHNPDIHIPLATVKPPKEAATKVIIQNTLWAGGFGLIPMPFVDAFFITATQLWMIKDIADIYGVPFKKYRVKSFISSIVGNTSVMGLIKIIPGIGAFLGGAAVSTSSAATTFALGQIFLHHFEQGGTLRNFNPHEKKFYFRENYLQAQKLLQEIRKENKTEKRGDKDNYQNALHSLQKLQKSHKLLQKENKCLKEMEEDDQNTIQELQEVIKDMDKYYLEKCNQLNKENHILIEDNQLLSKSLGEISQELALKIKERKIIFGIALAVMLMVSVGIVLAFF